MVLSFCTCFSSEKSLTILHNLTLILLSVSCLPFFNVHLTCSANAITPAAIGAAAEVPLKLEVHP